jgi:Flp pilus assembly protein CpaB
MATGMQISRRGLRLAWWRHRRGLLILGALLGAAACFRIAAPGGPRLVAVPVAAHDLAAGAVLGSGDVRSARWPAGSAPAGLLADPLGHTLAGPVRAGEPLTDARMLGPSLLAGQPDGTVAVTVRLSDAGTGLVHAGDRVDVLAATSSSGTSWDAADLAADPAASAPVGGGYSSSSSASRVATSALVLWVGSQADSAAGSGAGSEGGSGGGLGLLGSGDDPGGSAPALVLAVDRWTASRLAAAQAQHLLSVTLLAQPSAATITRTTAG